MSSTLKSDRIARSRIPTLIALLALWSLLLCGFARPAFSETKGEAKPTPVNIYAQYLKDPTSLGFTPNDKLFDAVFNKVKSVHPDNPSDEKLYAGVAREVGYLLQAANIPTDSLTALPHDASLPLTIFNMYNGKIDPGLLWYAMIQGVFRGTDDPHSFLMTPKEYKQLHDSLTSQTFGGIGIYIELDKEHKNQLTVVEPVEGTPAFKAGLQTGDQIVRIDGKSTENITLDAAMASLRGPKGSRVVLSVCRPPDTQPREVSIERAEITIPAVTSKMLPNHVAYVRLRVFSDQASTEFTKAIDGLIKSGAKGLLIDLRNNGGGYVTAAEAICSHFLHPSDVVTSLTDKQGIDKQFKYVPESAIHLPTVLLVNDFSASASEITASCLKEYGVATLVGVKTYGKGSAQQIYELPNGAAFKITTAYWCTPKGNRINKTGIEPDVKVPMDRRWIGRGDKDVQMLKAVEMLTNRMGGTASP